MRMLETQRFILCPPEEKDLKELLELQWDRSLMTYMNFKPLSMKNQYDWLNTLGGKNMAFCAFEKDGENRNLFGLVTLNNIDTLHQRFSWGLKLKSNLQGKGVGFELSLMVLHYGFAFLNMQKIYGDILFDNIANRKMCQKIGVTEEGVLRNHYYQNGGFRDVVLVGILKNEFYEKNDEKLKELGLI